MENCDSPLAVASFSPPNIGWKKIIFCCKMDIRQMGGDK
jgi:hypothetical protein